MANRARVRVVHRRLVKASGCTAPSVVAMSNLDLLPQMVPVSLFCVYREPSIGSFDDVVSVFEASLPSLLDHFSPLAGRLVVDPLSGLPEVHCSNQGADLVVGEVDVALASLDFSRLEESLARIGLLVPYDADVALSVQLVWFACGGFAVAWGSNHVLVDGHAQCMIASMWSELARSGAIAAAPNHDRSAAFRPRDVPAYSASLRTAFTPLDGEHVVSRLTTASSFVQRLYYIEAQDLAMLRAQASHGEAHSATRMEALSAYMWKAFAAVVDGFDERCRMGWWVNGRPRLAHKATAMPNYVGNVMTLALAASSVHEIGRQPLPDIAAAVREAIHARATDEHFQELVDWVEEHKPGKYVERPTVGLGSPLVTLSSFTSFHLDTDFGFGRAALVMPMAAGRGRCCGFVQIFPHPGGDGSWFVKAFVWPRLASALDSDEQRIFKPLTAEYLGLTAANPYSRM